MSDVLTAAQVQEKFWSRVTKGSPEQCWEWTGGSHPLGYGRFHTGPKIVPAHRFSYELLVGPIPDGLHIDHLCRNPRCVNPAHLEPVTRSENSRRGVGYARTRQQTHCMRGHEFTEDNTYWTTSGLRQCVTCKNERQREYREQKREAKRYIAALEAEVEQLRGERDAARARAVELETEDITHRLAIRDTEIEELRAAVRAAGNATALRLALRDAGNALSRIAGWEPDEGSEHDVNNWRRVVYIAEEACMNLAAVNEADARDATGAKAPAQASPASASLTAREALASLEPAAGGAVRAGGEAAAVLRALAWTTEDGLCWCPDGWFDLDEVGYQEHGFGDHSEGCVAARVALGKVEAGTSNEDGPPWEFETSASETWTVEAGQAAAEETT